MGAFKVRALIVSMGGIQLGADVKITRGAANRADLAAGDTFYLPAGAQIAAASGSLQGPANAGTLGLTEMNVNLNGGIYTGYKAGSAQFGFVINGTALVFSVPIHGEGAPFACTKAT